MYALLSLILILLLFQYLQHTKLSSLINHCRLTFRSSGRVPISTLRRSASSDQPCERSKRT